MGGSGPDEVCLQSKGQSIKPFCTFSGPLSKLFPGYQYLHLLEYHLQFLKFFSAIPLLILLRKCFSFSHTSQGILYVLLSFLSFSLSLSSIWSSYRYQEDICLRLSLLFSHSVVSSSLWPHGLVHTRLPCPSLSPRACSNSHPLSRWCHPTLSFSVTLFSSCPQSFPASGSFPLSLHFISGGQIIGTSALASVLPVNIQGLFPLGSTSLISLQSKGVSRIFSSSLKHQFFGAQPSDGWSNSHIHTWLLEKT